VWSIHLGQGWQISLTARAQIVDKFWIILFRVLMGIWSKKNGFGALHRHY
jgi:hypothetical protein